MEERQKEGGGNNAVNVVWEEAAKSYLLVLLDLFADLGADHRLGDGPEERRQNR